MPDYVATANALRAKLNEFVALPRYWPNSEAQPAIDAAPNGFVYSEIRMADGRQESLGTEGNRLFRDYGELVVWVCVPRGSSAGTAEQYAQQIRALFAPVHLSDVLINSRAIGKGRDGSYNQSDDASHRVWCIPVIIEWSSDRLE